MAEYYIKIPNFHPTRLNALLAMNYHAANNRKIGDMQMIAAYAMQAKIPKAKGKRKVEITIEITKGREPDPDAYFKVVHDALKQTGYIIDDSSKYIDFVPTKFVRTKHKATVIRLTDIEAA